MPLCWVPKVKSGKFSFDTQLPLSHASPCIGVVTDVLVFSVNKLSSSWKHSVSKEYSLSSTELCLSVPMWSLWSTFSMSSTELSESSSTVWISKSFELDLPFPFLSSILEHLLWVFLGFGLKYVSILLILGTSPWKDFLPLELIRRFRDILGVIFWGFFSVHFIFDLDEDKGVRASSPAIVGSQLLLPFVWVCFDLWEDGVCVSLSFVHFVALCDVTQELSRTWIPRVSFLELKESCKSLKRPLKLWFGSNVSVTRSSKNPHFSSIKLHRMNGCLSISVL